MVKIGIHQPEFLPWVGFFSKMAACDKFILFDLAQFNKQSFQNRNRLPTHEGWKWVTVPVQKYSSHSLIKDMQIKEGTDWAKYLRGRIESNYRTCYHFREVWDTVSHIWEDKWINLLNLNYRTIESIASYLDLKCDIILSSSLVGDEQSFSQLTVTEKNLLLCKLSGATHYISGPFGRDYLDVTAFSREKVTVEFHDVEAPQNSLHPEMSIIDTMFRRGKVLVNGLSKR